MSAWPEAVWIVKKLQANFDFEQNFAQYTQNLNNLNNRVNQLIDSIGNEEDHLDDVREELMDRIITFSATDRNGEPNPAQVSGNYADGAIWLVRKG